MAIRNRRQGREAALRTLYQIEVGGSEPSVAIRDMHVEANLTPDVLEFAERLVRGVLNHEESIDESISARLIDWTLDRIPAVDRNILRIGCYELYHCAEIPPAVTLNEAIELAKKYSTAESGRFVNGVLGRALQDSPKADWNPAEAPSEQIEESAPAAPPEVEETTIEEGSPEAEAMAKVGLWKLRSENDPS
jgi:N utilization substance protein B